MLLMVCSVTVVQWERFAGRGAWQGLFLLAGLYGLCQVGTFAFDEGNNEDSEESVRDFLFHAQDFLVVVCRAVGVFVNSVFLVAVGLQSFQPRVVAAQWFAACEQLDFEDGALVSGLCSRVVVCSFVSALDSVLFCVCGAFVSCCGFWSWMAGWGACSAAGGFSV